MAEPKPAATLDGKGLTLRPAGDVSFNLGGRLHADFGTGGAGDPRITGEFPDAAALRRLWIEPTIKVGEDLIFNFQYDPVDRVSPVNNLYLSYKGSSALTITGGNFKEPFSLEQLISNNDITFLERSLADTFAPARNTGFALGTHGDTWTLAAGVFGGNVNASVDKGGIAGTARATWAPILTAQQVLHLGIAGGYREIDRRGPAPSFDTSPESFLFKTSLVDTDTLDRARSVGRLGLEAAYAAGPVRVQAEYIATRVERDGLPATVFQGGYVYAAWVIIGRAPEYAVSGDTATEVGVFKRVKPEDAQRVSRGGVGVGVFELAARLSAIDLDSREVRGGVQRDATLGLNWYPEPNLRVLANYIHAQVDHAAPTGRDTTADIGQVRLQIAF